MWKGSERILNMSNEGDETKNNKIMLFFNKKIIFRF